MDQLLCSGLSSNDNNNASSVFAQLRLLMIEHLLVLVRLAKQELLRSLSRSNRRGANGGEGGGSHLADDRQGGFVHVGAAVLLVRGGGGKRGSGM